MSRLIKETLLYRHDYLKKTPDRGTDEDFREALENILRWKLLHKVIKGQRRVKELNQMSKGMTEEEEWDGVSSFQLLQRSDGLMSEYQTLCGWKLGGL